MANASKDQNGVSTLIGVLDTDGETIVRVEANPTNHGLAVDDGVTGDDYGPANALHDDNGVATIMAVSSTDGVTPVVVYTDSDGKLLIDSN